MHIDSELMKAKIGAFRGRDERNNRLVLETLAVNGPLIKYDIFKTLKPKGVKHYPTLSRRVDNLKERGYVAVAGRRPIKVGKKGEESPTYALTWRGFIASLMIESVIENITDVLENDPLLKFDLPQKIPKKIVVDVLRELFTLREIEIIARAVLVGFLRALPRNIESIKEENYLAYLVPGLAEVPEIKEKFEKKDFTKLLQIPGLLELVWSLIETYERQLSEALSAIQVIKGELVKYTSTPKQKKEVIINSSTVKLITSDQKPAPNHHS